MITIKLAQILEKSNLTSVKEIVERDGLLLYPTDTVYGMGGNAYSTSLIKKIDSLKGRENLPYSVAVSDFSMLEDLVKEIPEIFHTRLSSLFPGKFTFLFKPSPQVPPELLKGNDRIGIRIPAFPPLLKLIHFIKIPFITTSINVSGRPALRYTSDIINFASQLSKGDISSIFIDAGDLPPSKGSTIVDLTTSPIRIIREGDEFQKILNLNIPLQ